MSRFLELSGVLFWIGIVILVIYMIAYGKKWFIKFGIHLLSLTKFNESLEKLYSELPHQVKKETVSEVTGTLIWRITRIGLIALIVGSIPIILLFQQNKLIRLQNILFTEQNEMISVQADLLSDQNQLIKNQLRPYVSISTPIDDISITLLNVMNAPAFIDSLVIEYYVKEFGNEPFELIDRQVDTDFTIYPTTNQTIQRIKTNILTKDFTKDLKKENKRLMRKTKIIYSNLNDEIGSSDVVAKFKSERIDFLSKKNNRWYLKKETE